MKLKILFSFLMSILFLASCKSDKEVADKEEKIEPVLKTRWTDKVDPENVLSEYPA